MDKINVYIGTIKKCLNVSAYKKYGDVQFVPYVVINGMADGVMISYTEIVKKDQVLVKQSDLVYNYYDESDKLHVVASTPLVNGDLFVDESTLVPYIEKEDKVKSITR